MKITDEKLLEYGFKKDIHVSTLGGDTTTHITFYREYNYYLHNVATLQLYRSEHSKLNFPQFEGKYILKVGGSNITKSGVTLKSQFDEWKDLENIWLGLTGEPLKKEG